MTKKKRGPYRHSFKCRCRISPLIVTAVVCALLAASCKQCKQTSVKPCSLKGEAKQEDSKDKRMKWWREARFGMFIHWGLYAIPAGEWNGKRISGTGEWIMQIADIPVKDYEKLAGEFNPVKFNADEWSDSPKIQGLSISSSHRSTTTVFACGTQR